MDNNNNLPEEAYWLGLAIFKGFGPKRFFLLKKHFGTAEKIWRAAKLELQETGLEIWRLEEFISFRNSFKLYSYYLGVKKRLIRIITFEDKDYPRLLKEIDSPPVLIFVKGEMLAQDINSIAVVGTRRITSYGRQVTERLVRGLVSHNITIVSGLARGVDSVAHRTALACGGRTLAVLGSGLDIIYPPENKNLAQKICQQGALISEFGLGIQPYPYHFPQRNRIISGLSKGVLVTESASHSGSKITANFALEQNREVFAVPGDIDSPMSEGPTELIKMGAKLVTKASDILEEVKLEKFKEQKKVKIEEKIKGLNSEERKILGFLENGQRQVDEIIRGLALPASLVSSTLTIMEVKGMVKNIGGGRYCII